MNPFFHWKHPRLHRPDRKWCCILIFLNVTLAAMAVTIDLVSLLPTMLQVGGSLSIDDTKTLFIPRLYMFGMGIGPLISVRLGKLFGYKKLLFYSVWVFLLSAIGVSLVGSYAAVLFLRTLGGVAGGLVIGCGLPVINHYFAEGERRVWVALHSSTFFGLGIAVGVLLGGYFGQVQRWDWIFWINGYICAFVLTVTLLFHGETEPEEVVPFDFRGLFSIVMTCFFLFYMVSQAKAPWVTNGWQNPIILGCMILALLSFTFFVLHSLTAKAPFFDLRVFEYLPFTLSLFGIAIVGFMVFGVTMSSTLMLQQIYNFQHWQLGLFMSQIGLIYFVVGAGVSILIAKVDPRIFVFIGLAFIAAGCFYAQTITIQSTRFELGTSMWIRSIGVAMTLGPITVFGTSIFSKELYVKGVSLLAFVRQMSGVFGSSIISLIASTRTPLHITRFGEQATESMGAYGSYLAQLQVFTGQNRSGGAYLGEKQAQELLRQWIEDQASIQGLIDAEYILGWLTVAIFCMLAVAMLVPKKQLAAF